jgi:predicted nucleic-acid-binding Zn-ribbon protein
MEIQTKSGRQYRCAKCQGQDFDLGEIRVAGGFWSSIFDLENRFFTSLTCTGCSYTEFYKVRKSDFASIADILVS